MFGRPFWTDRLQGGWRHAPIVWLTGVRRAGKTTLVKSIDDARYVNCDLPSSAQLLSDPEAFLRSVDLPIVVFDEIHQLPDPTRVLKIAADEFSSLKIVATGSSTLAATSKFRDTLTGRKRVVHLVPVLATELETFGVRDITTRLLRGGLPPALLADEHDRGFYLEWLDSYFARDVQELFRVDKRAGFLLMLETLLRQNGGLFSATSIAQTCGLTRPTVMTYLDVLSTTHAVHVLRPYHGGGAQELVRQTKVYGFDTGFVAHARGWTDLRPDDCGQLWENVVLEHLLAQPGQPTIHFWRDKSQREVDFVVPQPRGACDAIECKWDPDAFDSRGIRALRAVHPRGRNFVVAPHVRESYTRSIDGMEVTFAGLHDAAGTALQY